MKRIKSLLASLLLLGLILFPSREVLAQNQTLTTKPDQKTQLSVNALANTSISDRLAQTPLSTPSVSETPGQNNPAAANRVFLPMLIGPQQSYFVSTSGNDSNPGTRSQPWRSIQKAANTLVAGDTVKILPGTYYEKFAPKNSGTAQAYITYTADPGTVVLDGSGVSMSPDSKGDGLVQIQGKSYIKVQNLTLRNASVNCVNISENSSGKGPAYLEISHLTIQNCNNVGIRARFTDHLLLDDNLINHINYSSGIGVWWSNDIAVIHNTITNAHYYHVCQGAYDEALTISWTNRFEVANNTLDNTEANPAGFCSNGDKLGIDIKESSQNGLVHNNTIRHMTAGGIYVDGWDAGANGTPTLNHINIYQNIVRDGGGITVGCEQSGGVVEYINIYNNLVLNTSFSAIQVRGAYGDGLRKNINIYNNTIYGALPAGGNGGAGIYITTSNLGSNNGDAPIIIRNNISMFFFLSSSGGAVGQIRAGDATIASMITADHNIVYGPQVCSLEFPACVEMGGRTSAAPATIFANPAALDLHLKSGTPAVDAGLSVSIVPDDFDGVKRPTGNAYDIGAYEYR